MFRRGVGSPCSKADFETVPLPRTPVGTGPSIWGTVNRMSGSRGNNQGTAGLDRRVSLCVVSHSRAGG